MGLKYNGKILNCARMLRAHMTKQERRLWYDFLRGYPVKFLRQRVIGNYIADFYCAEAKLVVELDGSQHFEDKNVAADRLRDEYFNELVLNVIRINNADINNNFNGVCAYIDKFVGELIDRRL